MLYAVVIKVMKGNDIQGVDMKICNDYRKRLLLKTSSFTGQW